MIKLIAYLFACLAFSANAEVDIVKQSEPMVVGASALPSGAATSSLQTTGNNSLSSIDGKVSTAAKQDTAQTTLDNIKTKTDNLDVLLSTRTKPADLQNITVGDSFSRDAAGRFRTSAPYAIFDDDRIYGLGDQYWETVTSGAGSSATFLPNESSVLLTVGTGATDYVVRQTRYYRYVPGKSEQLGATAVLGTAVANSVKRIGLFDDQNGLFFQQSGTGLAVAVRTFTSGSAVDTVVAQANWNIDKLDGTGASGITLDPTKTQLYIIDFLWQGVGRIRYGVDIGGDIYYVHEIENANVLTVPFITTPDLPVRYEIRNTDVSAGATMKQICVSLISEGGYTQTGSEFSADTGTTANAVTTEEPIIAIRMAATFGGKTNRKVAQVLHASYLAKTNDAMCRLYHFHDVTATAGGAWVAAHADSAVEYNVGLTSITAGRQHKVNTDYIGTGQGNTSTALEKTLDFINNHGFIYNNAAGTVSQIFAVYCTAMAGTSDVSAKLTWIE